MYIPKFPGNANFMLCQFRPNQRLKTHNRALLFLVSRRRLEQNLLRLKHSISKELGYRSNANGFTLPEALISVLVLAIGLVGVAMMQKHAAKNSQSNQLKAIAITQIGNMIDRMRANIAGVRAGYYDNIMGIPSDIPPLCITPCNSQQIAVRDAYYWNTLNAVLLPNGYGSVSKNNGQYLIILRWNGENGSRSNNECLDSQNCMSIGVSL